ncbi:methyl farnesoate epoxidase-like [Mya arenaria]|uniref:methyl farnesoate epoxidase-like n=1 Tax=Mya arenaria TaxID=6604 RepID=UPI0022E15B64|nr:methyl farnesoate epoxidase-like [Mya arenaria]
MEALELETHRLLLVNPTLVARLSSKDVKYKGYTIKEGTIIISNVWKLHHDEKLWGDPWKFRPERFLDENGQLVSRDHPYRTSWMPFGIGKRSCPGEPFARARYFLFVATLLRNWRFCPSKDQPLRDYDPRHLENFDLEFSIRPKPYLCRIEKREWN